MFKKLATREEPTALLLIIHDYSLCIQVTENILSAKYRQNTRGIYITCIMQTLACFNGEERAGLCASCAVVCLFCTQLILSFFSSSWCKGLAVTCLRHSLDFSLSFLNKDFLSCEFAVKMTVTRVITYNTSKTSQARLAPKETKAAYKDDWNSLFPSWNGFATEAVSSETVDGFKSEL